MSGADVREALRANAASARVLARRCPKCDAPPGRPCMDGVMAIDPEHAERAAMPDTVYADRAVRDAACFAVGALIGIAGSNDVEHDSELWHKLGDLARVLAGALDYPDSIFDAIGGTWGFPEYEDARAGVKS